MGTVLILAAGTLWGCMGAFVRYLETLGLQSLDMVLIRAVTTTILMFVFLLLYDRNLLKIKWKDLWCFVGTGIVSIVFFNYCYFTSITMTSLSVAAVLLYTAPAFVMLFSRILFGEKLTAKKIGAVALTVVGCVFVTGMAGGGESLSPLGILIGLGAGIGYALYSIFSRFAIERGYNTFTISFYTFFMASIGVIPLADVRRTVSIVCSGVDKIGAAFLFGFLSAVLAFLLYTEGLSRMDNGRAAIIASIEPVVATLVGMFVYGEILSLTQWIGVALVLGAIVMCNLKKQRH